MVNLANGTASQPLSLFLLNVPDVRITYSRSEIWNLECFSNMNPRKRRWTLDQNFDLSLLAGHPCLHEQII